MNDMLMTLGRWQLDIKAVRERLSAHPRHGNANVGMQSGCWRGLSAAQVAEALERGRPHHWCLGGRVP